MPSKNFRHQQSTKVPVYLYGVSVISANFNHRIFHEILDCSSPTAFNNIYYQLNFFEHLKEVHYCHSIYLVALQLAIFEILKYFPN